MSKTLKSWALLLLLACIWGSSFILMKKGMYAENGSEVFSDSQVGALRMLIAGLALSPFAFYNLRKISSKKDFLYLAIVGFSGNFFPAFLFTYAETGLSSGFAGMLNSFTPIFTIILGFFIFKSKISIIQIIGVIIATLGIISLVIAGKNLSISGTWFHVMAIVLATLFYAISLNTIKYKLQHIGSLSITSLAFLIVLPTAIFANFQFGTIETLKSNNEAWNSLFYILILALFGTAIAVVLFNILISSSSALFASSVTYFIPIVAASIGFLYGEKIDIYQISSMLVVLAGIFTVNYSSLLSKKVIKSK